MIEIKNISKSFGDVIALKDITLKFGKKEVSVIIGSSGSGKSTLIRCLNYLEEPSAGVVVINDIEMNQANRHKLCSKIGMVFQQFYLFPHMNVLENLLYSPVNIYQKKIETEKERAYNLLRQFSIEDKALSVIAHLSGGQKQRVAICRALMLDPEILLFDEPTSALDPEVIGDIIEIIRQIKQNMGMVIVTHDIGFAKAVADRVIFMDHGEVLEDQAAEDFFASPISERARLFLSNVYRR